MNSYSCDNCKRVFINTHSEYRTHDKNIHYFYCESCIGNYKIYSKTLVKKKFYLNFKAFEHLKTLYLPNRRNTQKYYLYSDIINILNNNFSSMEEYLELIKIKDLKRSTKQINKSLLIESRRIKITQAFSDNKLEFNCVGDCYAYINYGKPSIETILINEFNKLDEQNQRRIKLANILSNYSIILNKKIEKNQIVNNYIKHALGNANHVANEIKNIFKSSESKLIKSISNSTRSNIIIDFE